jgi:hypothetical protein
MTQLTQNIDGAATTCFLQAVFAGNSFCGITFADTYTN